MKRFLVLLVLTLIGLGVTFYLFPVQREQVQPEPPAEETAGVVDDTALRASAEAETSDTELSGEEESVEELVERMLREIEEAKEAPEAELEPVVAEEAPELVEEPVVEETVTQPKAFSFAEYGGGWNNTNVEGSAGVVELDIDPDLINPDKANVTVRAFGGRFVPDIILTGQVDVTGENAEETGGLLAGDIQSTLNEDGTFIFDMNVPRYPFSVVFRGEISDDHSKIKGKGFVYIDGAKPPTSVEECPGEPICHVIDFVLDQK